MQTTENHKSLKSLNLIFGWALRHFAITLAVAASYAAIPLANAQEGEYAVLMKTLSNPFWGAMGMGVEDGAKAAGVKYFVQAVESDQAAEPQLNVCNTMLERKPVAMITAAINSTNLLPCLKAAQEAGIKVVDLDGNLDPAILEKEGINITFRIGSDNVAAGAQGAEYLVSKVGADAKGPVLVIEGLPATSPARSVPQALPKSSRHWRRVWKSSLRCRATGTAARLPRSPTTS